MKNAFMEKMYSWFCTCCVTVLYLQVQDRGKGWSKQLQDLRDGPIKLQTMLFKHPEMFANDWPIIWCDSDFRQWKTSLWQFLNKVFEQSQRAPSEGFSCQSRSSGDHNWLTTAYCIYNAYSFEINDSNLKLIWMQKWQTLHYESWSRLDLTPCISLTPPPW